MRRAIIRSLGGCVAGALPLGADLIASCRLLESVWIEIVRADHGDRRLRPYGRPNCRPEITLFTLRSPVAMT
jgi:hypothetical protein